MALTKLITDLIDGSLGTDWQTTPKTADFTAVAGEGYFVNTTSTAITVTLPSSPNAGDEINLVDYAGTANTNNITITSSDNINGASDDVLIDYERGGVSIVYVDATQGWIAYNAANETASALNIELPPLTVDYLVVAGGGGGGHYHSGGGAGAGGLRTSYGSATGGGGSAESSLTLSTATNYTVTIGAGGNGGINSTESVNGNDSVFGTITSTGGGGGAGYSGSFYSAKTGGSGGAGTYAVGMTGAIAVTSPVVQGFAGGNAIDYGPSAGGGGGGAGAVGVNASSGPTAGNGGAGLAVNIINTTNATSTSVGEVSGSDVYFGGGGGGGANAGTPTAGTGGIGGGGNGAASNVSNGSNPTNGSPNTGGGGGASASSSLSNGGADGGSGLVILRYPSAYTITVGSGITEASGSPFTEGSDKVSVFAGGTGNITFAEA